MTVTVDIYQPDGTTLIAADLSRRKGVRWQDDFNLPGAGSVQLHLNDAILSTYPALLDEFNIARISVDGTPVKAFVCDQQARVNVADPSDLWVTLSGQGVMSLLSNAVVYPEYPLYRASADERGFDYGAKDGGWLVTADWVRPVGVRQGASVLRRGAPTYWPDPYAQWLWSSHPDLNSDPGHNYFRGAFHLTTACRVKIFAAADNSMRLQLDNNTVLSTNGRAWRTPVTFTIDLNSGWHLIAADVNNNPSATGGDNPAGFLCVVAQVDRNNRIIQILRRTHPDTFRVRSYGPPPGWFAASILKTLVSEAQTRGVEGLTDVTFGFSDTLDSDGVAWTGRQDRSFEIGTRDLLDVCAQLSETDMDVDLDATMTLQAWADRGSDLSGTVTLSPTGDVLASESTSNASAVRTRALVRHAAGWVEVVDTAAQSAHGRREAGLQLGSTSSDTQAERLALSALGDLGEPEVTLTATITSAVGPQPYADFDMGDVITCPGVDGTLGAARVMSITADENDDGLLTYTLQLYPEA